MSSPMSGIARIDLIIEDISIMQTKQYSIMNIKHCEILSTSWLSMSGFLTAYVMVLFFNAAMYAQCCTQF